MDRKEVQIIHQAVFDLLSGENQNAPDSFFFTLRKNNSYKRLDQRYWFHGNDSYMAISFWDGFDYANKTPNISFVITLNDLATKLEVSAADSVVKLLFIKDFLLPVFPELKKVYETNFQKHYTIPNYLESLRNFLNSDKKQIDYILKEQGASYFNKFENSQKIQFFTRSAFEYTLRRTLKKYDEFIAITDDADRLPVSIESIRIKDFGPIINIEIKDINPYAQFIFIAGENGGGKSSILRAITTGLTNDHRSYINGLRTSQQNIISYQVTITLRLGNRTRVNEANYDGEKSVGLITPGFAAYGPHRLITTANDKNPVVRSDLSKLTYSIFNDDGILLDTWNNRLEEWSKSKSRRVDRIADGIKTALHDLNEKLQVIIFPHEDRNKIGTTAYVEKDAKGNEFDQVEFKQLASGIRSIIAMFGDMMLRLFEQQPNAEGVADLKGIVIIDEIDLHLHPNLQRDIIEKLGGIFPKVQFIITTHSPIPLLGAPKNSVIIKIERFAKQGVIATKLDFTEDIIGKLMPNAILTSPIFGMRDILPNSQNNHKEVRSEDNWREIKLNDAVKSELQTIYKRLKENAED